MKDLSKIQNAMNIQTQLIKLLQELKKSMMHKLFTEGIGHTEFKDSEIGRIPKEWEVAKLGETIDYVKGKKPKELTLEYKTSYIPYLSTEYLREDKNNKFVGNLNNIVLVNEGDLILLWDGSNAGEVFRGKYGVLSSTMVRIELKSDQYNKSFFYYLLKLNERFIKKGTKGTGIPHADRIVLNNINIPILPLEEQKRIAYILSTIDDKISIENKRKESFEKLFKTMLSKLMSGQIRTTNIEVVQ